MPRIELKAGLRLAGGFVLGRLLGRGSGTEVWTAVRPEGPEGEVAVKVLRDKGRYAVLCAQAAAAGKLIGTARTVKLVASHLYDDPPFFSFTPAFPASLRERLEPGKPPLLPREALAIFRDIIEGLAEGHDRGVPHAGLKAENVLLGAGGRATLTDFGGVLAAGVPSAVAADLAAAGALLHLMVTGAPLPPGERPGEGGDLPLGIDAIIARSMSADPGRPPSARALLSALDPALVASAP